MSAGRSLKSLNMKWLVLLAIADVLMILFFVAPELLQGTSLTQVGAGRLLTTTVMPVVVLLLVNVLPHDLKSSLVYWRPLGVLPGCEAFSKHGPSDVRVNMDALRKNVGAFPSAPADQNAMWYKLFKQVAAEPEVMEAHKLFLMYRDMAVMSLVFLLLVCLALFAMATAPSVIALAASLFTCQFFLSAISARWSGIRFVCNVLALHSAKKYATRIAARSS